MLSTEKLLDILAQRDLLPEKLLASLRQQVAKASNPIRPEALAKRLVEAGHLTPALAQRLLAALPESEAKGTSEGTARPGRESKATPTVSGGSALAEDDLAPLEDDFDLAPLEDESNLAPLEDDDDLGLAPLEDVPSPRRPSPKQPTLASKAAKQPAKTSPTPASPAQKPSGSAKSKASQPPASPPPGEELVPLEDDDDLGLAPLEDVPTPKRPSSKQPTSASKATKQPTKTPKQPAEKPSGAVKPKAGKPPEQPSVSSLLDEELAPLDLAGDGLAPLDGLLAAGSMDAASAGSPLMAMPTKRKGLFGWLKRGRGGAPRRRENVWESPVLLISGGVLVGLLILGAVLLWTLGRQSGDEALAAANEEYRAGSYTQAIHKFDQFLDRFPNHGGAGSARVTRGLARLRQATVPGADWTAALADARQVLKEIQPEDAFGEAAGELAAMLPAIAEGLAARARETNDPAVLKQAREALELAGNRKIVPARLQPTAKLAEIEAQLALVDRQIHQGTALDAAVAAIEDAVARGDANAAYETRRELLRDYPMLAEDAKLTMATRAISAAQQVAVRVTEQAIAADSSPGPSSPWATATLAERMTKEPFPDAKEEVFVTVVAGSAYGFNVADGRLLWRRYVGEPSDGLRAPAVPVAAGTSPSSDWFVVAPAVQELWRLDARTGQPRWRLPVGEPVDLSPVLVGKQLILATRAGRLHVIDAESGASVRQIELPQPVAAAPAVDTSRGLIYQVADHSNLFVLELTSGRCLDVVHLGHAPGSIAASPVLAAGVLLVPLNDRARTATLRVYGAIEEKPGTTPPDDSNGEPTRRNMLRQLQEFRVHGQFDVSPAVVDRNVVALTDLGAVHAYELSAADPEKPLIPTLERKATDAEPRTRYCLLHSSRLFLADNQLTRFDVRTAEGRLAPRWVSDEQSAFLQPPRPVGNALVHVRRRGGQPGVIVAAVHAEDGRTLWQNRIAVPPADRPIVETDGGHVVVVASTGAVFRMAADAIRNDAVQDEPAVPAEMFRVPISVVLDMGDGTLVLSGGAGDEQLVTCKPSEPGGNPVRRVLPGKLTCPPVLCQGGVLAPCLPGHVFLLDPRTNETLAAPFQPPLTPNTQIDWRMPAVGEGGQVAITDGGKHLFDLAIEPKPTPHWKAIATVELEQPIVSPLASAGNMVFAVDEASVVTAYELPELERREQWPLEGPYVWGPVRVGPYVLLATKAGELMCFGEDAKRHWQVSLAEAPPVGATALDAGRLMVATAGGTLLLINAADGRESGRIDLERPLGTAFVPIGGEVLGLGRDGTLYRVEVPQ